MGGLYILLNFPIYYFIYNIYFFSELSVIILP